MKNNKVSLRVSLVLPEGVSRGEIRDYVRNAVRTWVGSYSPEDPIFDLNRKSVKVSLYAAGRKLGSGSRGGRANKGQMFDTAPESGN